MLLPAPEVADVAAYKDAPKDNASHPAGVERAKGKLKTTITRSMRWPGSEMFAMWGHHEGPEEATPEYYRTDCAIRMLQGFAKGSQPWHMEVHYIEPHDAYMPLKKYVERHPRGCGM